MSTILLIILILLLLGVVPTWPHSREWGYGPAGVLGLVLLVLLILMLLGAVPRAWGHDWYSGLTNIAGERCCNSGDCGPVRTDGAAVQVDGSWVVPEPGARVDTPSWDGATHACIARNGRVRCVIRPSET